MEQVINFAQIVVLERIECHTIRVKRLEHLYFYRVVSAGACEHFSKPANDTARFHPAVA